MKFKQLFCSFFQAQNSYVIQKSMKHVDASTYDEASDYRIRRERNNESVRKSRAKNRVKLQECATQVQELKSENVQLNRTLDTLQSELFTLKGLFQHCFAYNLNNLPIKPSDVSTSTLYNIIMKKDMNANGSRLNEQTSTAQSANLTQKLPSSLINKDFYLNDANKIYSCSTNSSNRSNQTDSNSSHQQIFNPTLLEHDYSKNQKSIPLN